MVIAVLSVPHALAQHDSSAEQGWRTAHLYEPRLAALQASGVLSGSGVVGIRNSSIGIPFFTDTVAASEWVNTSMLRQITAAFLARQELACRCTAANRSKQDEASAPTGRLTRRAADRISDRSYEVAEACRRGLLVEHAPCDGLTVLAPSSVDSMFLAENNSLQRSAAELGPWTCPDPGPAELLRVLDQCRLLDAEARAAFSTEPDKVAGTTLQLLRDLLSHYSDRPRKRDAQRRQLALLDSLVAWGDLTVSGRELLKASADENGELTDHSMAIECTGAFMVNPLDHSGPADMITYIADRLKEQIPSLAGAGPLDVEPLDRNGQELTGPPDFPHVPRFLAPLNRHLCDTGSKMRVLAVGAPRGTPGSSPFVVLPLNERSFRAWMHAVRGSSVGTGTAVAQAHRYRPTIGTVAHRDDQVFGSSFCADSVEHWWRCFLEWGMLDHVPADAIDSVKSAPDAGPSSVLAILARFPGAYVGLRQLQYHRTPYLEMLHQLTGLAEAELRLTSAKERRKGWPTGSARDERTGEHRPVRSVIFVINGHRVKLRAEPGSPPMSTRIIEELNMALRSAGAGHRIIALTGDRWPCVVVNRTGCDRLVQLGWTEATVDW